MRKTVIIDTPDGNHLHLVPTELADALHTVLSENVEEHWLKTEHVVIKFTVIQDTYRNEIDPMTESLVMNAYYRGKYEGKFGSIPKVFPESIKNVEELTE